MLGCYLFPMAVLVPELAETVPSHVDEVIPGVASFWPAVDHREARLTVLPYVLTLAVLFGAYGVALRCVAGQSSPGLLTAVFGTGALIQGLLATSPVLLANDVYSYAAYGRMFALSHVDPALALTQLPEDDPYTKLWGEHLPPSSYGPVWTLMSAGIAVAATQKVGLTVLLYRGVAILAVLGAAAMIAVCLRRLASACVAQGVLFFLWNPLVGLESALSAHNDAVMIAFFLAGIALHLYGGRFGAILFFALSVLIKFATAPLIPIYMLMVLRQMPTSRARIRFLAQAAGAGMLALAIGVLPFQFGRPVQSTPAFKGPDPVNPVFGWWVFQQRYTNSLHELLYRAVRIQMGEEPDDVHDVEYWGWWAAATQATSLRSTPDDDGPLLELLPSRTAVLVIQPRMDDFWMRVYAPQTGQKGYVLREHLDSTDRPALAESDPVLIRWEMGRSPIAERADIVVKLPSWILFGLAWLIAAFYARDVGRFLLAAPALLLASFWLIDPTFWPWYLIWAVALAALVPASGPALLSAVLSATTLMVYATMGFDDPRDSLEWIYTYRSITFFGVPLAVFAGIYWSRFLAPVWSGFKALSGGATPLAEEDIALSNAEFNEAIQPWSPER
jgi:hypothetical protein